MAGSDKPSLVYFMTIDNAKFRRPVVPGDRLEIHVRKLKKRGNIWRFACEAIVDGGKAAEARDFGDADAARRSHNRRVSHAVANDRFIPPPSSSRAPSSAPASSIGPFCHVGADAVIGDGVELVSHVSIIGRHHARRGLQGLSAWPCSAPRRRTPSTRAGRTTLVIGRNCTIREGVTMHRGTDTSRGETTVGDNGNFLAYAHIAHDCIVGNNVTMANLATLGGHCEIGDFVNSAACAPSTRSAASAITPSSAAWPVVVGDVIPYGMVDGQPRHACAASTSSA